MRRTPNSRWLFTQIAILLSVMVLSGRAADSDSKIDASLMKALAEDSEAAAPFFVVFAERANVKPAQRIADRAARGRFVVQELEAVAERAQAGVRGYLGGQRIAFTPFWVENKIYVPGGTLDLARSLARRPEVAAILPEVVYTVPEPQAGGSTASAAQWNIRKINADQVAATGSGMVVANIDTGVQYNHPALVNQYRGNNAGVFTHTGNWKDPTGACVATPCDNNGHGTHTMGTMVGDDGTTRIGVAPGAKWIACKGCATSSCASSALTTCAQWILDPLGDGTGANQPDAVNNSWGGGSGSSWYESYIQNWRAAGIFPAFSIGNSGPNCSTAGSPGDNPEAFASGATDSNDTIASWSSRGPSLFGGILKPNVTAPGVSIVSSYPTNTYATMSGTSMASPHTAGSVALLWSANSSYRANIGGTEAILTGSAFPIGATQTCGSLSTGAIPNNTYGYGRIDVLAAVNLAAGTPVNQPPVVSITAPANSASYNCPANVTFSGTASDAEDPTLSIVWTDSPAGSLGTGTTIFHTYDCTTAGNHVITAKVTDSGGASDTDSITISIVNPAPAAPSNLAASVSNGTVTLTWVDNSGGADFFVVERKSGGKWITLSPKPITTTFQDTPGKGTFQYRVSASKGGLLSAPSNVITVKVR